MSSGGVPAVVFQGQDLPLTVQYGRAEACSEYVDLATRAYGVTFRASNTSYLRFGLELNAAFGSCGAGPGSLTFTGQLTALAEGLPIVCMPRGPPTGLTGCYQLIARHLRGAIYVSVTKWGNGAPVAYGLTFTAPTSHASFRLSLGSGTIFIGQTDARAGAPDVVWLPRRNDGAETSVISAAAALLYVDNDRPRRDAERMATSRSVPLRPTSIANLHLGDVVYVTVHAGLAIGTHVAMVIATSPSVLLIHEDGHRHNLDDLGIPSPRVVAWLDESHAADMAKPGIRATCTSDNIHSWMVRPHEVAQAGLERLYGRDAVVVTRGTPGLPMGTIILKVGPERGFLDVKTFRRRVEALEPNEPTPLIATHILHVARVARAGIDQALSEGFDTFRLLAEAGTVVKDVIDLQHLWLTEDVSKGHFEPVSDTINGSQEAYESIYDAYSRAELWRAGVRDFMGETATNTHSVLRDFCVTGAWPYPATYDQPAITVEHSAESAISGNFNTKVHTVRPGTAKVVTTRFDRHDLFGQAVTEGKKRRLAKGRAENYMSWDV